MMKRILILLVLLSTTFVQSQEKTFEKEVSKISKEIDRITKKHKDSLKIKVKEINERLDKKEISFTEAEELKKEAAAYHANQIEQLVSAQELKLQQLVQDKTDGKIASESEEDYDTFTIGKKTFKFRMFDDDDDEDDNWFERRKRRNKRTTTQFVFALGVNNVLVDNDFGSLNNSDYRFWQSHFYELGFTWKTRLSKEPSKAYFKYGFSFLWNNLRADENRYHVVNGDQTDLVINPNPLTESRLRHVQMTFPMHFELDFSKNRVYSDDEVVDRTHQDVRIGLGGFFGFKLGTRQYLEYTNPQGVRVEEVQKNDFNTNTVNYGLSAYIAYEGIGLYAKYDLNPLFQNTDIRNISLGLRFDIN
ncbi:hypothetical protein EV195_105153 [Tenacibaculum skagerrakense]|uniref:Outer membrane protein with beta-barrel domain n=1 Tax=Tenacibaculum skagerrakense TaxID=186571 RepID=A0A4R2NSH1_9FLAO|nr:hypothetical protein [Tenacibaculum skagerrakense]TCP24722.1 hypothetical protein EV195_105153 [Tenacibaculum skagerrakense]